MQLVEPLVDLGEQRPARGRHHYMVRHLPTELLGRLERERLAAFGVVRPHVDVDERPLVDAGELRAQPVHVVVVAVDRDDVAAVYRGGEDFALLEVRRNEHVAAQPRVRGVRGDRVREISGRGARGDLEAELERLAERDRNHPILERVRGIARVVLDPHVSQPELCCEMVGFDQRRETRTEIDGRITGDRQEIGVTPKRRRAGGDLLAGDRIGDRVIVVCDFEWAEAPFACVHGGRVVVATALPAPEALDMNHVCLAHALRSAALGMSASVRFATHERVSSSS